MIDICRFTQDSHILLQCHCDSAEDTVVMHEDDVIWRCCGLCYGETLERIIDGTVAWTGGVAVNMFKEVWLIRCRVDDRDAGLQFVGLRYNHVVLTLDRCGHAS